MKHITFIFLLLLPAIFSLANDHVTIHGRILHPGADSINVSYYSGDITYDIKTYAAKIDGNGSFSLEFPVNRKITKVDIVVGAERTDLIVSAGDDMCMNVDATCFDSSLRYSGEGSITGNFCALHEWKLGSMLDFEIKVQQLYGMEIDDFKHGADALLQEEMDFLKVHQKGLAPTFIEYWTANYRYGYYNDLLMYPCFHERRKQGSDIVKNIPHDDYRIVADVPASFNDDLLGIVNYEVYLGNLLNAQLDAAGIEDNKEDKQVMYAKQDSLLKLCYRIMPHRSAEFFAGSYLFNYANYYPAERNELVFKQFRSHFPHSSFIPAIERCLEDVGKMSAGKPELDFSINTIDGKTMKLSDLKGKVVMIDFWESGCVPCINEMRYANKIEEHYKDNDVVFLYISIDVSDENWKKAIGRYNIMGMHMRDGSGPDGEIARLYDVKGEPSYYLIDKNGKFGPRPVPRPSDGDKLKKAIDALLN